MIDPIDPKRSYVWGWSPRAETLRYDPKSRKWVPFLPAFSGEQIERSPDGQWLVYRTYPGGELHKCRVDGSGDLNLAGGVFAINPHWSPDGKRIAFAGVRSGTNKSLGLWLVSAGGGDAAPYRSEIDFGYDAIWSKDGRRILFAQGGARPEALPAGESRIRILDLDTGKIQTIPKGESLFWSARRLRAPLPTPCPCAADTPLGSDLFFQSEHPLDYRPMAALFVRRRIVSASSNNCLLYLCRARYFADSSWVASSATSSLRS